MESEEEEESGEEPRNKGVYVDTRRIHSKTPREALKLAGLIPVPPGVMAPFVWVDGILTRDEVLEYGFCQRFSKIPGMDSICYKSTFFSAMNELSRFFPMFYTHFPRTFILPQEFLEFQREHMSITGRMNKAPTWIVKPRNSCCGRGIFITQSAYEVQQIENPSVIQLYINPCLVDRRKFDFRIYLLIASLEPLTLFIYPEGIARFCSEEYSPPNKSNRDDKFAHLTNTAINVENGDVSPADFTRRASTVLEYLKAKKGGNELWSKIIDVSRVAIMAVLPKILKGLPKREYAGNIHFMARREVISLKRKNTEGDEGFHHFLTFSEEPPSHLPDLLPGVFHRDYLPESFSVPKEEPLPSVYKVHPNDPPQTEPPVIPSRKQFFHIIGIDIIINKDLEPQVLELNDRPSLEVTVPFEKTLKESMIKEAFEHLTPTGDVIGSSPNSQWQKIFPLERQHPSHAFWTDVYRKASHPKANGEIDGTPPITMVTRLEPNLQMTRKTKLRRHRPLKKKKKHQKTKTEK